MLIQPLPATFANGVPTTIGLELVRAKVVGGMAVLMAVIAAEARGVR
jgi:hypothetical protein